MSSNPSTGQPLASLLQRWRLPLAVAGAVVIGLGVLLLLLRQPEAPKSPPAPAALLLNGDTVRLEPDQVAEMKVGRVESRAFQARREAFGMIDFDQDHAVQVFSPYQGRIGRVLARAGDEVRKGQLLYTVQIPDLAQAASTLIAAAGNLQASTKTLERAQGLAAGQSIPQREAQKIKQ